MSSKSKRKKEKLTRATFITSSVYIGKFHLSALFNSFSNELED